MYTLSERIADAIALLTQAIEQSPATERVRVETICSLPLGEAYVLAGRLEEAHACAEQALARARGHQKRGCQAYALRLLGEIGARPDLPERERAAAPYRQALALTEERGIRLLQSHCHFGLGTLYAQEGWRELARAALSTDSALFRALAMPFCLPRTEVALAEVEGQG